MRIVSPGRHHLQLLHVADPVHRVEHGAAGPFHIAETFQRGLARIAAGRHQDADLPLFPVLDGSELHQVGQQLQRDILERQCRPVEQLHDPGGVVDLLQWRDPRIVKSLGTVSRADRLLDLRGGIVLQINLQDVRRAPGIILAVQIGHLFRGKGGKHGGNIQPAVRSQSAKHGLAGDHAALTAGGKVSHGKITPRSDFGFLSGFFEKAAAETAAAHL